jgi:hypothetical protein
MFSYCECLLPPWLFLCSYLPDGIAASLPIAILNYVLLGFMFRVDGFYMHSFEIFLATSVVFFGAGNVGYTLLEYRLGKRGLVSSLAISWNAHVLAFIIIFPSISVNFLPFIPSLPSFLPSYSRAYALA